MTLTTMIGALVALLPPALLHPKGDRVKESDVHKLVRSQARLIEHIHSLEQELLTERHTNQTLTEQAESLERRLAIQRGLTSHWSAEAMRLASESRERRDAQERYGVQQALGAQQAQAQLAQQAQIQNGPMLGQYLQAMQTFGDFCNCVPSRSQVWAREGDQQGAIIRVNNLGDGS